VVWKFQCRHHADPSNIRHDPQLTLGCSARVFFM